MTSGVDAAPVRLVALSAADMAELAAGAATFRGWEVADGALPPDFIFDMALLALAAGADPLWAAPRAFVLDREGRVVGTGGYKGPPDAGRVEIGSGMAPAHRGRG
jgi:ribosomal-protein-alanine N-acetyltransferase